MENLRSFFSAFIVLTAGFLGVNVATAAAEIQILGNGVEIVDGDTTARTADHTFFGLKTLGTGGIARTFTIKNTSPLITDFLFLTGTPLVSVSGATSADFVVTALPAALVTSGASTTFQVTWTPTSDGIHNATLSIENNDSNENPYNFAIQATAILTLDYAAGPNGTLSGDVEQGGFEARTAVTAVPDTGYHFVNWSDGSTDNPRTDTNATQNLDVTANFALNTYTLDYTAGTNGSLTGTTPQTVNHGAAGTTVIAVPDANYHFVNWSDASTDISRADIGVTGDLNVTANFAINTYTLTYTSDANGLLTGPTPQTIDHGADGLEMTAVPTTGYHFVNWSDASTDNPRTDTSVTADLSVSANFAINTYTLNYTSDANGSLTGSTPQTIDHGADGVEMTAVPMTGYYFVNWSDASTDNPRTDTSVTGDLSVTANFAINTYTLSYTSDANGSLTGSTSQTIDHGADGTTVTAVPDANHYFVNWSDASTANPRTETDVTAELNVTANFAINTYTLTYTAGANGTLTGTTPQTIDHGSDGTTVTAVPDSGFHFVDWSDSSTANPRTDTNVQADLNVTANFDFDAVNYTTGTEVPLSVNAFIATGSTVAFTLNFAPTPGTQLMVVEQTGPSFIEGNFDDLVNGAAVDLTFGGTIYHFSAWYYGGDGNDLVLLWRDTGLAGWGNNQVVPSAVPQTGALAGKTIVALTAGAYHSVALCSDGTLAAWGTNHDGQLGDGSTTGSNVPVAVDQSGVLLGKTVVALSGGAFYNVALCSDGTLAAWGYNGDGRLGDGSITLTTVPVAVTHSGVLFGKTVVTIATGDSHSLALCADGTVVAWGYNGFGALGDGSTAASSVPVDVTQSGVLAGKTVVAIAAGNSHSLALCSDGTLAAWGRNGFGALGDGSSTDSSIPVAVTTAGTPLAGKSVVALAAGGNHSLALCSDGTLAAWGNNNDGQIGDGSGTRRYVPVAVTQSGVLFGKTVVAFAGGDSHSLALCSDGTLAAWGENSAGQLGNGSTTQSNVPVAVDQSGVFNGNTAFAFAADSSRSLALYFATPSIAVEQPLGINLAAGSASVDFGTTVPVGEAVELTFTVRNNGLGELTGLGLTLDGTDEGDFSATLDPASVLAAGDTTTFTVRFVPSSAGAKSAALHLASNDAVENLFNIALSGTAGFSEIAVEQPATNDLTDGSASIDFGTAAFAGSMIERTFTVQSLGTADVTGLSITFDGTDADDFSVIASPAPAVTVGDSTTFTVRFLPASGGVKTATLHLASNDADESPFDIELTGAVTATLSASYSTGTDVPLTTAGFTGTGNSVNFALNYAPVLGTSLMVVSNTAPKTSYIQGTFDNLANGAAVDLTFGGKTYHFTAWYYGGDGNDLVLLWRDTGLAAWGSNSDGQLGDASNSSRNAPVAVTQSGVLAGKTIVAVSAGSSYSLALCADGTLAAWGSNQFGKLGDGSYTHRNVPVQVIQSGVLVGKTVVAISADNYHNFALCADGTLAAWGYNDGGQLGDGSTTNRNEPVAVDQSGVLAGKTIISLAGGSYHSLALCADGTLAAWGSNQSSQLGNGSSSSSHVPVPVDQSGVLAGKTVVAISAGSYHSFALCSDGTLAAWGFNDRGQLGDNSTTDRSVPVDVTQSGVLAGKTVVALSASRYNSYALCADGTLAAWGWNGSGALGNGSQVSSSIPVAVDQTGVLAGKTVVTIATGGSGGRTLNSDGTLVSWGIVPVLVDQSGVLAGNSVFALASGNTHDLVIYAAKPKVAVEQPLGVNLTAGSASTDFGTTVPVGEAVERTFTVRNTGLGELTGLALTLDGTDEGDFSVILAPASMLAVGDTTTFTVRFVPSSAGAKSAALHLASNEAVENLFDIALSGTAGFPEIALEQPAATDLTDGSASIDFGAVALAGTMIERTFTVQSLGTADVTGLSITFDGTDASDFSVSASPASAVAPGNSTTFTVRFLPSSAGVKTAALHLASNDADESPFDIELTGSASNTLLTASYSTGTEVPLTTPLFTATGNTVNFTLDYAPLPGTHLMVVNNTGSSLIVGTFENLANGAAVDLTFGGKIYHFVAWYYGGDGNDLVLLWRHTGLAAWGDNALGQLGDGSTTQSNVPVNVDQSGVLAGKTVVALASGANHTLALCSDGTLAAWGDNAYGQLGDGSTTQSTLPVEVTQNGVLAGKTVVAITCGIHHSLALCSDGTLAAWGRNDSGQLGDDSTTQSTLPVDVTQSGVLDGKSVVALAAGFQHSLVLCSDGTLAAWGENADGQLGDGSTTQSTVPVAVTTAETPLVGKTIVALDVGVGHNLVLCSDGTLAAWGNNSSGQLGDGSTTDRSVPVAVTQSGVLAGKTVVALDAGYNHSLALCSDGTLAAWGNNRRNGQLGDGTTTSSSVPVVVTTAETPLASKTVVALGAGGAHNLALCSDGSLAAWGNNSTGQLGDGSTTTSGIPVAVDQSGVLAGKTVVALAPNGSRSLVLYAVPLPPEIGVEQPVDNALTDGSASIDFGDTVPGESAVERTFTVRNFGSADLTGLSITLDGTDASDFSVTAAGASVLAPGATTTFTVSFAPASVGAKSAALHLASNDADESPFDIALSGTGVTLLELWRQTYFGPIATNTGVAADDADPYATGVSNLLTFAFFGPNQDPTTVLIRQLPQAISNGSFLTYTFTEPAGVSGITYGAEWSATLGNDWLPITDTGTAPEHIFSVPMDVDKKFIRLSAEVTPAE